MEKSGHWETGKAEKQALLKELNHVSQNTDDVCLKEQQGTRAPCCRTGTYKCEKNGRISES